MPLYTFECPKCKERIELMKSIKDDSCPLCCIEGCDGIEMNHIIVGSSFHLKGLGWAAEGYSKTGVD